MGKKGSKKIQLHDSLLDGCNSHLSDCYRPESNFSPILISGEELEKSKDEKKQKKGKIVEKITSEKEEDLNEMFLQGLADGLGE